MRLRAGYAPPHWVEGRGGSWDAGYEATGFFLDWLEERYGHGTVAELNDILGKCPYDDLIFKALTGRKIGKLWKVYREHLSGGGGGGDGKGGGDDDDNDDEADSKPGSGEPDAQAVAALSLN